MADSDASTVDPNDSDASTVDPEYLEETIELDPTDIRNALNNSPDLFADYPVTAKSETKKVEKLSKQNNVEKSLLKPITASKRETLVKRRSKVHELSDSESESEEPVKKIKLTSKSSAEAKHKVKVKNGDSTQKPYKRDYSKMFESKSDTKLSSKEKIDKQKFISEFLKMSDDDTDSVKFTNGKRKEEKEKTHFEDDNKKGTETKKKRRLKVETHPDGTSGKKTTPSDKVTQSKSEMHQIKKDSVDSVSGTLKRKSNSPSPQVLKKSDTELLCKDTNTETASRQKPACKYGSKCYRKNLSHRQEFSHLGKLQFWLFHVNWIVVILYTCNMVNIGLVKKEYRDFNSERIYSSSRE